MRLSRRGTEFIAFYESFLPRPYWDDFGQVWTQGFGHTEGVTQNSSPWTRRHALEVLRDDADYAAGQVKRLVSIPLNQHEADALISFVFNLGPAALGSSTLLHELNQGHRRRAARQFGRWVYAGGQKLPGLVARRKAERRVFLHGKYGL